MRKVVLAIGVLVVIGILAYLVLHHSDTSSTTSATGSAAAGGGARRASEGPSLGSALDPEDPVIQKFQARKADGLAHLQGDLEARLRGCEQAGGAEAPASPPKPRTIAVTLDWDDKLSTPELQRFVVSGLEIVGANDPISTDSRRCLDRAQGTTLNVLLPGRELPAQAHHLQELISLPLR